MKFPVGTAVRYKPGFGTYGYEDALEDDGRLPGIVVGHTPTRVRVELTLARRGGATVHRTVDAKSLSASGAPPCDHKFVDGTACLKCGWVPK